MLLVYDGLAKELGGKMGSYSANSIVGIYSQHLHHFYKILHGKITIYPHKVKKLVRKWCNNHGKCHFSADLFSCH